MSAKRVERILVAASVFALVAIMMMVWSLLDPHPLPVIAAMSIGQAMGTLSLGTFLVVVVADIRRAQAKRQEAPKPPLELPP